MREGQCDRTCAEGPPAKCRHSRTPGGTLQDAPFAAGGTAGTPQHHGRERGNDVLRRTASATSATQPATRSIVAFPCTRTSLLPASCNAAASRSTFGSVGLERHRTAFSTDATGCNACKGLRNAFRFRLMQRGSRSSFFLARCAWSARYFDRARRG